MTCKSQGCDDRQEPPFDHMMHEDMQELTLLVFDPLFWVPKTGASTSTADT